MQHNNKAMYLFSIATRLPTLDYSHGNWMSLFSFAEEYIRELKIDNSASSKTRCQYISTERSCLEFDCFNNHL